MCREDGESEGVSEKGKVCVKLQALRPDQDSCILLLVDRGEGGCGLWLLVPGFFCGPVKGDGQEEGRPEFVVASWVAKDPKCGLYYYSGMQF